MLRREKVSKLCDVYSYGVLLFEIATQQLPFSDVLPIMVPSMIIEGKVRLEGTNHFKWPCTILVLCSFYSCNTLQLTCYEHINRLFQLAYT